jgi:hypothetical protein
MELQKFIKKPIEVTAVLLTPDNVYDALLWANAIQPKDKPLRLAFDDTEDWRIAGLQIPTKEGAMLCGFGDYLIKEPFPTDDRMFYPCKADMFHLTYQSI